VNYFPVEMNGVRFLSKNILLIILVFSGPEAIAQVEVAGTVYDQSGHFALQGVSVMGTSGTGTATDSSGHYRIGLPAGDSIYFSYLGKRTEKFPVKDISYPEQFDMSLQVHVDSLEPVYIRSRNYQEDSLENRMEYRKIFDYDGPDVLGNSNDGAGMGISLDLLFSGRRNRRMLAFRSRLLYDEQEKYIDHRFSRALVKRITGLEPPALDTFMRLYRPGYDFIRSFYNDYEYYSYILRSSKYFLLSWKEQEENKN
jgi:hypothetical protein